MRIWPAVSVFRKICFLLLVLDFVCRIGSAQNPASAGTPSAATHAAASPERLSLLAHRLLVAAFRTNGLAGDSLKPWHIKVDFEMLPGGSTKPLSGTFEEWYADRYHWRRTYTSSKPEWTGSEWRAGKAHRYVTKRRHFDFMDYWLTSRVGRPVVNPLYQVDNIRPEDELLVVRDNTAGLALNCTSLAHPSEVYGLDPEWIVPTMCFDSALRIRAMRSQEILLQFDDFKGFQGRPVARDVQVITGGRLFSEMKVVLLENWDKVDDNILKTDAEAAEQPLQLEAGDPAPVPVFQTGAAIPLVSGYSPYRGALAFPVILHKDGSVKVEGAMSVGPIHYIWDAVASAVNRWKYKPYLVDGQPVEVEFRVIYNVDGKPFVPMYERQ